MEQVVQTLRAAGEPTRVRILRLCAQAELSVSELGQLLGQSQPRVSRHLKCLIDAGLLERNREGIWAFYRVSEQGSPARLARAILELLPGDDPVLALDLERLRALQAERTDRARAYFRANSARWNAVRSLYVDDSRVEEAVRAVLPRGSFRRLLDIGTGTGRMLELLGPEAERAIGIDISTDMLAVARAILERAGLVHCQVRKADMYRLPLTAETFDAVTLHMVLHYAESPRQVIGEAARVLEPGGRLLVVDFAPHHEEQLRETHHHRWMGFGDEEMRGWLESFGLEPLPVLALEGSPLTVCVWSARRPEPRTRGKRKAGSAGRGAGGPGTRGTGSSVPARP